MTYAQVLKFDTRQARHPKGSGRESGRWMSTGTAQRNYIAGLGESEMARIRAGEAKIHASLAAADEAKQKAAEAKQKARSEPLDRTPEGKHQNTLQTPVMEHSSGSHELGGGVNTSMIVEIEGKSYVFKPIDGERHDIISDNNFENAPLAEREVIASRLDTELEFGVVPATVMAYVDGRKGSLQEFVADAEPWGSADTSDVSDKDIGHTAILDMLLANTDRHGNNVLVKDNRLIAIDHGYTMTAGEDFQSVVYDQISSTTLTRDYQRELAERINKMDLARVLEGTNLDTWEREAFDKRRKYVVERLQKGQIHNVKLSYLRGIGS